MNPAIHFWIFWIFWPVLLLGATWIAYSFPKIYNKYFLFFLFMPAAFSAWEFGYFFGAATSAATLFPFIEEAKQNAAHQLMQKFLVVPGYYRYIAGAGFWYIVVLKIIMRRENRTDH